MKAWLIIGAVIGLVLSSSPTTSGQDDPNAQYIVIRSGVLSSEPLEIEIPIEVGVLRLQISVEFKNDLNLSVITPFGRPLNMNAPNISLQETRVRRGILMWDPRPGKWKLRLSGSGSFTVTVSVQGELYVCCMQFFGRSGAYMMDRFQPSRTTYQQAQVYTSGNNLETIDFQLIDEQGEPIDQVRFRQSDFSNPSGFTLMINTPNRPFRVLARGRDTNGKSYQRVFHWLIKPQSADPADAPSEGSIGTPSEPVTDAVEGEQRIIRARVVKWSDELLFSEKGNPLGIRLRYSIIFPVRGFYSPYPQLYPERIGSTYTGALSMRVHRGSIDPLPEVLQNPSRLVFGERAIFAPDITYNFTVDLVPNYTSYSDQKMLFCLQTRAYNQQNLRERFEREVMSESKLRFRLSISGTDIDGRLPTLTENSYAPNTWYQGYQKEGVKDCQ